jgi:hypothetical protein
MIESSPFLPFSSQNISRTSRKRKEVEEEAGEMLHRQHEKREKLRDFPQIIIQPSADENHRVISQKFHN